MFLQQMKDATPQANHQSDLRHLFAYRPDAMRHLLAFTQAVMRAGTAGISTRVSSCHRAIGSASSGCAATRFDRRWRRNGCRGRPTGSCASGS